MCLQNALPTVLILACGIPLHLITEHFRAKEVQQLVRTHTPHESTGLNGKSEWLIEDSTIAWAEGQYSEGKTFYLVIRNIFFESKTIISRKHGSGNQGVEVGLVPFTFISTNLPAEFLLPIPPTLGSADLGRMLALVPADEKMRLYLVILGSLNRWTNRVKKELF